MTITSSASTAHSPGQFLYRLTNPITTQNESLKSLIAHTAKSLNRMVQQTLPLERFILPATILPNLPHSYIIISFCGPLHLLPKFEHHLSHPLPVAGSPTQMLLSRFFIRSSPRSFTERFAKWSMDGKYTVSPSHIHNDLSYEVVLNINRLYLNIKDQNLHEIRANSSCCALSEVTFNEQ